MEREHSIPTAPEWATREIARLRAALAAMKARITSLEEELASTRFNTGLRNAAARYHRELFARAERAEVELSEAKARIAELELRTNAGNALIRAEKAEADCKRAEAERDALREALRELLTCIDERRPYTTWQGAVADARAALNPPPAGRDFPKLQSAGVRGAVEVGREQLTKANPSPAGREG